ncbi:solute carrier family 23 protein [Dongshaea marina]|uniref:solute carrier family 23 protein n=1 Tax=Dongshaea marina TaxID=2047966 RepID=UPI0019019717|nr:solute carrier family 23 protein [Dongshaea marina]
MKLLYELNDRPTPGASLVLAAQHLLAAIGGIIAAPLLLGTAVGLPPSELVFLVNASLIASGLVTIIQCKGGGGSGSACL